MAFGILEYRGSLEHVPGTAQLEDVTPENTAHLKKGSGRNADIVLIPQPSNDPNDPLNWPLWQRDLILVLYLFCCLMCVGGVGPLLAVITFPILQEFHLTFTQVSLLTGYQLCTVGAISVFISALCCKYGKRLPFLVSMAFLLAGTIWCACSTSYQTLLGGRIFQGIGSTFFEGVAFSVIGDMYFVHQRGSRMAIFIMAQSGLLLLPSLIAGQIATDLSWRWVFWFLAIFLGVGFIGAIIFGWETAFNRNAVYNIDSSSQDNIQIIEDLKSGATHQEDKIVLDRSVTMSSSASKPRDSFVTRMRPCSTTYTDDSLIKLVIRPFFTLLNPAISWAVILIAFSQLWNVLINLLVAQLFAVPPYNLNTAQIGYLFVGPMVGGLLGCLLCGMISDPLAKAISRRNNGVYEPEFRLILMILVPIFCSIGYFLFGNLVSQGKSPVVMSVIWGIAFVSVQLVMSSIGSYLVDAFRSVSIEVFVASMAMKNFLFFGFSFFMNNWLAEWGPARTFNLIGGVMIGLSATTIPVYVFGKRMRAWWHQHDILSKW
ncbi:related to transporter protein HOL1 [Phialocephala subalpina]|uniref:Related to transporter protein HOL1 n=1 Tax=Phialocephala subalpina TaxID=576137 RepID=A0A1L7XUR1_9HELO|nr:related to transporter protein HOL1 [Phialocephala subalpina]